MRFDQQFIKSVIQDALFWGQDLSDFKGVRIDSREIVPGEIFVALKGDKVDGHDYISDAIKKGAVGLIISKEKEKDLQKLDSSIVKKLFIVAVPNTREALIKLACAWRKAFEYPVVGITGSIGKTTTKEILSNILKLNNTPFIASEGNQNTEIGLAVNILRMRAEHKVAIFEMGVNKRGEMAILANMVRPTTALITTVGHSHMEGLGSITDIAAEKRDIFKYFNENNIGIANGDQPILANVSYNHPIVKFGYKMTNQVQARKIQINSDNINFILKLYKDKYKISLNTNHEGRIINSLAAASIAYLLDIPSDVIVKGLQTNVSILGRFEPAKLKTTRGFLINDCYNASPESMKAALLAFEKLESKGEKIAVLGDMLELGINSPFWHRQLGRFLRKVPSLNHVLFVGNMVQWAKDTIPVGLSFEYAPDWQMALDSLKNRLKGETVILIKGSRGVELDKLVSHLAE